MHRWVGLVTELIQRLFYCNIATRLNAVLEYIDKPYAMY